MKVSWTINALSDLEHVQRFIDRDNPAAAVGVVLRIIDHTEDMLRDYPLSGRVGRVPGTRELPIPGLPFVVPYRVTETSIDVLEVRHTSRRWPDTF